jgi:hypothetical protein
VLPWESRRKRRNGRAGLQPGGQSLEQLEARELLAYTPLGFSLPDLTVSGYASTVAAWGGPLTVTVNVRNLGASTLPEPTNLQPGAFGNADAAPSSVAVLVSRSPHATARNSVLVGSIATPAINQNDLVQLTQTLTLPAQPAHFPGDGGKVFVHFVVNPGGKTVNESDYTNNTARSSLPVQIEVPLPDLVETAIDVPPVMQPGDTIQPTIRIANIGPASTSAQGPVTVVLVASTTRKFTSGSSILSTYTVANIPGTSQVSSDAQIVGDTNLNPQNNVVTITGAPVTLPTSPKVYFIGVVIDPNHAIQQIRSVGAGASTNALSLPQQVGPPITGLPPAGVVFPGGGANNLPFPYPPNVTISNTTTTLPQTGVKTS